jgi:choline dehydrogenase
MAALSRDEYDYVIVGAGSAGCVLAARLTEDTATTVLLIEAGGSDRSPIIVMPGAIPFAYQRKKINWGIQSGPEPELHGRTIDEKAGRVVGGSGSINAMIVNRGNPLDFEGWASQGLSDWDWAHVLPYFRKMETFSDGADPWRGGDGPLRIKRARAAHKLFDVYLRAGEQAGFEITPDQNGYKQEGLHIAQSFIHDGVRWTSSRAYLRPALGRPNLTLMKNALVTRVVVESGCALGVDVADQDQTRLVRASREVIVSAGAMNSPKLLMLSGIGDPDALRAAGVTPVLESRQVGQNLQNHPGVDLQFATRDEDSLTSELGLIGQARLAAEWALLRRGRGADHYFEAGAFLRTRDDVDFPNMQYEFLPLTRKLVNGRLVPVPGFQFWFDLSRPESRGEIRLKSSDPREHPTVVFRTYSDPRDLADMVDGIRLARQLVHQAAWDGIRQDEITPGVDVSSAADIAEFVRQRTGTSYHPSCACRMGIDDDAVVDSECRVNGVTSLRVVDASVMPRVTTGNLNAPTVMIAEKIADRIRGRAPLPPSDPGFYRRPAGI